MRRYLAISLGSILTLTATTSLATPILAPPGDPAFDVEVSALADGYQRQQDVFATRETGLSLDVIVKATEVDGVKAFFAQSAVGDFATFSGKHPFQVLETFEEYGDEGNFAGVASVGVAARLLWLRAAGAPESLVSPAREAAIGAARAWHVYGTIGGDGVVARGVRRTSPLDASAPPLPGVLPALTPLADAQGMPLPADKGAVWRAPVAPGFDGWIWMDDTSKDQVSGYALAAAWLWDALKDDPAVPADVTDALAADLVTLAKSLMKTAPELGIDLCLRDADGRLTSFHDLNPRQITPDAVISDKLKIRNGFNAALALGIVRAAYHVSGDPDVGAYYYGDLVGTRDLPGEMAMNAGVIFMGTPTNYSNVNMLAIALATIGRFETDTHVRDALHQTLESQFWSTGDSRDVSHVKQAWFDAVYGSYAATPTSDIRARVAGSLGGFQMAPAFQRDRVNCDDAEIAAGVCTAVDGVTTIVLDPGKGHGGSVEALDIVPLSVRPDSDFAWRTDPHEVNGHASTLMDPGGDFLAAYWLARLSDLDDTTKNVTSHPRMALPYGSAGAGGGSAGGTGGSSGEGGNAGAATAAGAGGALAGSGGVTGSAGTGGVGTIATAPTGDETAGGCGCVTSPTGAAGGGWALALALAATAMVGRRITSRNRA